MDDIKHILAPIITLLLIIIGCVRNGHDPATASMHSNTTHMSEGLLVVRDVEQTELIKFLNIDGTEWAVLFLGTMVPDSIQLWRYNPQDNYVDMRVSNVLPDRFEVVVNEQTGLRKFVSNRNINLVYMTWGEYLKNEVLLELPESLLIHNNPLDDAPGVQGAGAYQVLEVHENWAKIVPLDEVHHQNPSSGWVKWRTRDDSILVRMLKG